MIRRRRERKRVGGSVVCNWLKEKERFSRIGSVFRFGFCGYVVRNV